MFKEGYALIFTLIFSIIFVLIAAGVMSLVTGEISMSRQQYESMQAFFLAEAGIERAMASIRDTQGMGGIPGVFRISNTGITLDPSLDNIPINIQTAGTADPELFRITSTATVRNSTRSITAEIRYNPPAEIFDHPYFIDNWGWFYGNTITVNGDIRSNGNFSFGHYSPRVEGEIFAGGEIQDAENVRGMASTQVDDEYIYQHPGSPVLSMPDLRDLSYYEGEALAQNGTVKIEETVLVNNIYGDDPGETGNIVLIGTPSNPIEVDGPVVIKGDVVIKGTVKGQGTIYAGRNIYLADKIDYKNAPSSPRPASDNPDVVDQWVRAHEDNDIIGFAASENIIVGDYTGETGGGWYCDGWLFDMESRDGDNYGWHDVQTQAPITEFTNMPEGVNDFGDLATNRIGKLEGVFYTNNAFAARLGQSHSVINGAIISQDEAIIYTNSFVMNYDERIHSKYRLDPNWLIDLNLPVAERVAVVGWW